MNSQEHKLMKWCEAHNITLNTNKKRNNHFYKKKYQKKDKIKKR